MDKHKQFTETVHPVGALINPAPALATAVAGGSPGRFNFSEADLTSDFTSTIDPNGPQKPMPAVSNEVVAAPPLQTDTKPPTSSGSNMGNGSKLPPNLQKFVTKRNLIIAGVVLVILLLAVVGLAVYKFATPKAQMINDSSQLDASTLYIDSSKKTVGVKSPTNPDGLQVGATVSATAQGSANIRLGLINGTDPSILFEDNQKNSWQVLGAAGSIQLIQGTQVRAKLDDKALTLTDSLNVGNDATVAGNTTLGRDSGKLLTIQGTKVAIPNNLNFADNTLFVEANRGVAIGASTASGFKLLVAGTLKVNSSLTADGQVIGPAGSAKSPSFTFSGNTNTGLYRVAVNVVGVAAAGNQVLQVQQGSVLTVNGANIEADGYLRAGRGANSPFFQVARFTGTLDGSGTALVSDGLSTGYARVLLVQAFYKGNSSEAIPMNVDFVNSGNFQISGGIPGRAYRATLFYSQDNAGW